MHKVTLTNQTEKMLCSKILWCVENCNGWNNLKNAKKYLLKSSNGKNYQSSWFSTLTYDDLTDSKYSSNNVLDNKYTFLFENKNDALKFKLSFNS